MNDEKTISEREAVKRERKAFEDGMVRGSAREFTNIARVRQAASEAYPLPKITRPRVVDDPHDCQEGSAWRVVEGRIEYRWKGDKPSAWRQYASSPITPERVAMWANLLANPTEEVPDDA